MFPKINTIDPYISLRLFEVKPKYVGYSSIDARNQSFAIHDIKNYEKFSNAGLFYTSPTEITCYCCGMKFCNWLYEKHLYRCMLFEQKLWLYACNLGHYRT